MIMQLKNSTINNNRDVLVKATLNDNDKHNSNPKSLKKLIAISLTLAFDITTIAGISMMYSVEATLHSSTAGFMQVANE